MPIRRQANGNLLVQFQYLGKRVHRSAGTRSVREAKAFEEELRAEVEHSKKFLLRGRGLRHDFAKSRMRRRRALPQGARRGADAADLESA